MAVTSKSVIMACCAVLLLSFGGYRLVRSLGHGSLDSSGRAKSVQTPRPSVMRFSAPPTVGVPVKVNDAYFDGNARLSGDGRAVARLSQLREAKNPGIVLDSVIEVVLASGESKVFRSSQIPELKDAYGLQWIPGDQLLVLVDRTNSGAVRPESLKIAREALMLDPRQGSVKSVHSFIGATELVGSVSTDVTFVQERVAEGFTFSVVSPESGQIIRESRWDLGKTELVIPLKDKGFRLNQFHMRPGTADVYFVGIDTGGGKGPVRGQLYKYNTDTATPSTLDKPVAALLDGKNVLDFAWKRDGSQLLVSIREEGLLIIDVNKGQVVRKIDSPGDLLIEDFADREILFTAAPPGLQPMTSDEYSRKRPQTRVLYKLVL